LADPQPEDKPAAESCEQLYGQHHQAQGSAFSSLSLLLLSFNYVSVAVNFPQQENSTATFSLVAGSTLTNPEQEELSRAPAQPGPELETCLESIPKSPQQNFEGWHHRAL